MYKYIMSVQYNHCCQEITNPANKWIDCNKCAESKFVCSHIPNQQCCDGFGEQCMWQNGKCVNQPHAAAFAKEVTPCNADFSPLNICMANENLDYMNDMDGMYNMDDVHYLPYDPNDVPTLVPGHADMAPSQIIHAPMMYAPPAVMLAPSPIMHAPGPISPNPTQPSYQPTIPNQFSDSMRSSWAQFNSIFGSWSTLVIILIIIVIFYVLITKDSGAKPHAITISTAPA
jgi:hypothetical protein